MSKPRDLRELVGDDVPAQELEQLRGAHDALLASDAPPEIPDSLTASVLALPGSGRARFTTRRALAGLAIAAAIGGAAFGIGFWAGGDSLPVEETITLNATNDAPPDARMVIDVLPIDAAGNWPMVAEAYNLPPLPDDGFYEVWLARDGEAVASCGRFRVDENGDATDVWLNAPYGLKGYDRWVVTAQEPGEPPAEWLLDGPVVVPA